MTLHQEVRYRSAPGWQRGLAFFKRSFWLLCMETKRESWRVSEQAVAARRTNGHLGLGGESRHREWMGSDCALEVAAEGASAQEASA